MKLTPQLIERLAHATFCRPAIVELAELFKVATAEEVSTLVAQLAELGEDVALDRLLNVCAYLNVLVEPTVLAKSAAVIADLTNLPYCYVNRRLRT